MRGDLPGYIPTPENIYLHNVYGEWVCTNYGGHLSGGITDNTTCQARWRDLAVMSARRYKNLGGNVGRHFVWVLSDKLQEV